MTECKWRVHTAIYPKTSSRQITMNNFLLIKTGDTFPEVKAEHGDFEAMIADCIPDTPMTIYDARNMQTLPDISNYCGVIITGSHAMVSDEAAWSERLLPYLRMLLQTEVPVLGICFGHQLLAKAVGGAVAFHPHGIEAGSVDIHLNEAGQQDALLGQLPATFKGNVGHYQSVLRLPDEAVLLAGNEFEPHEAFRLGRCMWGVQFHPEFTQAISRQYTQLSYQEIKESGADPEAIWENCVPTPQAKQLLQHFVTLAKSLMKPCI